MSGCNVMVQLFFAWRSTVPRVGLEELHDPGANASALFRTQGQTRRWTNTRRGIQAGARKASFSRFTRTLVDARRAKRTLVLLRRRALALGRPARTTAARARRGRTDCRHPTRIPNTHNVIFTTGRGTRCDDGQRADDFRAIHIRARTARRPTRRAAPPTAIHTTESTAE